MAEGRRPLESGQLVQNLAEAAHGSAMNIPVVHDGEDHVPPGQTAEYIMGLPFKLAFKNGKYASELLKELHERNSLREPMIRPSRGWNSKKLYDSIGKRLPNIESALMQIVGTDPVEICSHCAKSSGPWTRCIEIQDADSRISACANCHWHKRDRRCDFYREETTQPVFEQTPLAQPEVTQEEGQSSQEQPTLATLIQGEHLDQIISHVINMGSVHREQMIGIQEILQEILDCPEGPQIAINPGYGYSNGDIKRRLSHKIHEKHIAGDFLILLNMLLELKQLLRRN